MRRRAMVLGAGGAGLAVVMTACARRHRLRRRPTGGTAPGRPRRVRGPEKKKAAAGKALAPEDRPGGREGLREPEGGRHPADGGEFKAFTAICTHQGCTVDEVADGTINCPCHGSKFKISDGSVAGGPASEPLEEKKIKVSDGKITLA